MEYSYSLEIGKELVTIEVADTKEKQKEQAKKLLTYYSMFLKNKIGTKGDVKKEKLLDRIINSLSDEGIVDMMSKLKDDEGKAEVIETVNELMDAYEDDDFENYIDEKINGNTFTYLNTLNIDSIRDKLAAIGSEMRGKKWRIEFDEEGKVVLCE